MEQIRRARFLVDAAITSWKSNQPTRATYALWQALRTFEQFSRGDDQFWLVDALYHYGVAFAQCQLPEQALTKFDDCLARFGEVDDPQISAVVSQAAISAGISAFDAGRTSDALRYLDRAVRRLRSATAMDGRRALASALVNRAAMLRRTGQRDDAETAYTAVYEAFRDDDDPEICRQVSLVLHEKAKMLDDAELFDRAAAAFREVVAICGSSPDPAIVARVAESGTWLSQRSGSSDLPNTVGLTASRRGRLLVEQGATSLQTNAAGAAIDQLNAAVDAFGPGPRGEDRLWCARAIHNRAMALQALDRNDEAVASFRSLLDQFTSAPEEEIRNLITSALTNAAVAAGSAGEFAAALGYVDQVLRQLNEARTVDDRRALANAMYNRATLLKMAGRIEDASAAFDATCERFQADDDPRVCRFVALALYNKADALANTGMIDRALPAYRRAIEICRASFDPVIRERAARAFMGLAGALHALGRTVETSGTLEELLATFGSAAEPAIQQLIGQALTAQPSLLMRLPVATHAWDGDYNQQMFGSIVNDYKDRPDLVERKLTEWAQLLDRQTASDAKTHADALAVLERSARNNTPYALFLRNFSAEAFDVAVPMGMEFPFRASVQMPGYSTDFEARIRAALGRDVPIISIANPSPNVRGHDRIPKLEVNNDLWPSVLHILIDSAGLIVMLLTSASRGVFEELEMIVQRGLPAATVVIVSPKVAEQVPRLAALKSAQLANGVPSAGADIPRFALVLDRSELPNPGGPPLTAVTDLIDQLRREHH
jgi:tetratricopeptide (TPR) repeat protein